MFFREIDRGNDLKGVYTSRLYFSRMIVVEQNCDSVKNLGAKRKC